MWDRVARRLSAVRAAAARSARDRRLRRLLSGDWGRALDSCVLPQRKRPRYLLLRYRWCHGEPRFGPSNEDVFVSMPLRSAGVAEVAELFYEEGAGDPDRCLLDAVVAKPPSLVVLSSYDCFDINHPSFELLAAMRARGIPLVVLWHDSTGDIARRQYLHMREHVDLHVLFDSSVLARQFPEDPRLMQLWAPLDTSVFKPGDTRDLPVVFLGSTGGYRGVRGEYLRYLDEHGIAVHHAGGQAEQLLDLAEYAALTRRAKIALNFSQSLPGTHQLKARAIEVLFSGTLLLESENEEIKRWLKPMVHYVPFLSASDLAEKIRYYLAHDEERRLIAQAGHDHAIHELNHDAFWRRLHEALARVRSAGAAGGPVVAA